MGSKKHKKHHKSDKKEKVHEVSDRPEKHLKLVLKVGGSSASEHGDSPHIHSNNLELPPPVNEDSRHSIDNKLLEKHKKSKKKKKKKSSEKERHEKKHRHHSRHHHSHDRKDRRKREHDESSQEDVDAIDDGFQPTLKRSLLEDDLPERPFREPRACTLKNRQGKSALQHLLEYLLKAMERKDPQQFFAWPVTDHIAPGYSSIITHPMDFSTMRQKIENNEYPSISDFKDDFKLMCDNAMTYNRQDTIYYKAAKKLLHIGLKMMTKDKLIPLRNTLNYMDELTRDELGFDISDEAPHFDEEPIEVDENTPIKEIKKKIKPSKPESKFEAFQEDVTPEEILAEAQKAASDAAAKLTLKRPNSKFGFLRQRQDGTTTLAILNPDDGSAPGSQERKVTLEMLTGKLSHGTGSIAGFKEDKRNGVKPVNYLNYGAFGSYAPSYDSTFANLTKMESDLLYSTYGDEAGIQYAESILNFAKDSDYMLAMVDNLLDALTAGEHSKTMKVIEEKRKKQSNLAKPEEIKENCSQTKKNQDSVSIDYDSLRSLAELGIDVSFLDDMGGIAHEKDDRMETGIQKKLEETNALLNNLQKVQHERLSQKPPPHLSHLMEPSSEEIQLADKVSESLKELAKQANPGDITNISSLRKAMGISLNPFYSAVDGAGEEGNPSTHHPTEVGDETGATSTPSHLSHDDQAADLESELREFLETGPNLRVSDSPNAVDQTLEENLIV